MPALTFGEILDAAHELPLEKQRQLASILLHGDASPGRQRVLDDLAASRAELERGECRAMSVDEIMAEVVR